MNFKKIFLIVILALVLILLFILIKFVPNFFNLKLGDGNQQVQINFDMFKVSNPNLDLETNPETLKNQPVCSQLPETELSYLEFSKIVRLNNSDIIFQAQYKNKKLPSMNSLSKSLQDMLKTKCETLTFPLKENFKIPAEIWNQVESVKPKPFTFYTGSKSEYYTIGFDLVSERSIFTTLKECFNQPAFYAGDKIVFYGFKKFTNFLEVDESVIINCVGKYDFLDHWEIQDE